MTIQEETATKPQMNGERRQLDLRKQDDTENTDRVISGMNAARRSMGIAEIR